MFQRFFYDNLFVIAVSTRLRPGKACGLTLKDVDFEPSLISDNKTLVYQKFEGDEKQQFILMLQRPNPVEETSQ